MRLQWFLCSIQVIQQIIWGQNEKWIVLQMSVSIVFEHKMCISMRLPSTDVLPKDLMSLEHPKFFLQMLEYYSRVQAFFYVTCLFVWASDELIGTGTNWLLLREGGNFSVIWWLIIVSEICHCFNSIRSFWQEALMCVHTGRQTDRQPSSTHSTVK